MSTRFDAIIIGTGQAGPSLAGRLSAAGWKVAVIERKRFGGTCVNNGCIPTKTLVASSPLVQPKMAQASLFSYQHAEWCRVPQISQLIPSLPASFCLQ